VKERVQSLISQSRIRNQLLDANSIH